MSKSFAFSPSANNVAISASTTSANGTLPGLPSDGDCLRVYNATGSAAFVRWSSTASPTAVTTDTFVAPGNTEVFQAQGAQYVAAILSSGSGTVYFQRGVGL